MPIEKQQDTQSRRIVVALYVAVLWFVAPDARSAEPTAVPPRLAQPLTVQYPTEARRAKAEGRVVVRLKVRSNGIPELVRIYSSSGSKLLDGEALRAVSRARFVPGRVDEQPTEMRINVPVNFTLLETADATRTTAPSVEMRNRSVDSQGNPDPIVVSFTAQGQAYLGDRPMDLDSLEDQLALRFSRSPNAAVHLRADRKATYQQVTEVLSAVNNAGAVSVKFIVEAP